MEPEALIESILFVAEEPITTNEFAEVLELPLEDVDADGQWDAGEPPLKDIVFNLYQSLQAQGLGSEGNHALAKALEHLAGMEIQR